MKRYKLQQDIYQRDFENMDERKGTQKEKLCSKSKDLLTLRASRKMSRG